jgi:hypothetical protein
MKRVLMIVLIGLSGMGLFLGGPLRSEAHSASGPAIVVPTNGPHDASAIGTRLSPLGHAPRSTDDVFAYTPGYIRPEFQQRMHQLRPIILAAARRHNQPELSGMTDEGFATVIALILYNEHNGWFEDAVTPVRAVTPLYQQIQVDLNKGGLGGNFSVWPANLRPSVALEILRHQLPVPGRAMPIVVPVVVYGSKINPRAVLSQEDLFAQITAEISGDDMAVEYLAANLERGLYRASFEDVPVSWRTLAAWHNQGIVGAAAIQQNATAKHYIQRAAAYLQAARQLIESPPLATKLVR